jgi:hypothetical protein
MPWNPNMTPTLHIPSRNTPTQADLTTPACFIHYKYLEKRTKSWEKCYILRRIKYVENLGYCITRNYLTHADCIVLLSVCVCVTLKANAVQDLPFCGFWNLVFWHWTENVTITKSLPIEENTGRRDADVHTCPIGIRAHYPSVLLAEDSNCLDREVTVIGHKVLE